MIPAFVATFLWSYCVVAARRSVDQLGENLANLARILVAVAALGLMAHSFGLGLGGGGLFYFALSGVIGFGLGDIGAFYAMPRIGSRLTILMAQCGAAPIAGLAEWYWMGTTLGIGQILAIGLILTGIVIALAPKNIPASSMPVFIAGVGFGLLAAIGQGLGAVISRKAYSSANAAGNWVEAQGVLDSIWMGATAGYQRLVGGAVTIFLFYLLSLVIRRWKTGPREPHVHDSPLTKARFVVLNAAAGPIFGLICFQWALATTPSAIVQPIIAMTPLVIMPMAWYFEGDRPTLRSLFGGLISVAGVILLALT
jgi:drug/metabolite transporter (DMT)-like permease